MDKNYTSLALFSMNSALAERQVTEKILLCNEKTQKFGLTLTECQALALAKTNTNALTENKRIEFGGGIVDKLITAICDSPYISQQTYEQTLHELIELFYELKNDTWERASDNELIEFIKTAFNGCCHGSMELLVKKSMQLSEHIHRGGRFDTFDLKEERYGRSY